MSAVVASAQAVTSHLLSYVILVLVAQVISEFLSTFLSKAFCVALEIGLFTSEVSSTFRNHRLLLAVGISVNQARLSDLNISPVLFIVMIVILLLLSSVAITQSHTKLSLSLCVNEVHLF
jgi:hypothetical protein